METCTQFLNILRIIQDYYNKKVRFNLLEHELGEALQKLKAHNYNSNASFAGSVYVFTNCNHKKSAQYAYLLYQLFQNNLM